MCCRYAEPIAEAGPRPQKSKGSRWGLGGSTGQGNGGGRGGDWKIEHRTKIRSKNRVSIRGGGTSSTPSHHHPSHHHHHHVIHRLRCVLTYFQSPTPHLSLSVPYRSSGLSTTAASNASTKSLLSSTGTSLSLKETTASAQTQYLQQRGLLFPPCLHSALSRQSLCLSYPRFRVADTRAPALRNRYFSTYPAQRLAPDKSRARRESLLHTTRKTYS